VKRVTFILLLGHIYCNFEILLENMTPTEPIWGRVQNAKGCTTFWGWQSELETRSNSISSM